MCCTSVLMYFLQRWLLRPGAVRHAVGQLRPDGHGQGHLQPGHCHAVVGHEHRLGVAALQHVFPLQAREARHSLVWMSLRARSVSCASSLDIQKVTFV